jgi:hypothetical protein
MDTFRKPPAARNNVEAIDRLVEILSYARERPEMYFDPIEPSVVEDWLTGLRTGVSIFGLDWSTEHRQNALTPRGLELNATKSEASDLRVRGLSPLDIVKELLSIEIDMWKSHRSSIAM